MRACSTRLVAAWGALALGVLAPATASAFGGVFFPKGSSGNANHHVAIATQKDGTVAWDQITWSPSTKELAWVLPMRPGAKSELTGDAFFNSLDATTQTVVYSPPDFGPSAACSLTGCSSDPAFGQGPDHIELTRHLTAKPIESLVIPGGGDGAALTQWLTQHDLAIPDEVAPAIAAYGQEGWDFQVYRFVPDCNAARARVARITTRGSADAVLPTRLLRAGSAFGTPITIYTFATTRLAPAGVSTSTIDPSRLLWRETSNDSNYSQLASEIVSRGGLLTELAAVPTLATTSKHLPTVYDLYPGMCGSTATPENATVKEETPKSCSTTPITDAGADADADADAEADAGADAEAGADADAGEEADAATDAERPPPSTIDSCASPDDLTVMLHGDLDTLHTVITRMVGSPSIAALATSDLRFVPAPGLVSNQLQAIDYDQRELKAGDSHKADQPNRAAACGAVRRRAYASWTAVLLSLGAMATLWARRRTR